MKFKFSINYRTEWGQQLVVCMTCRTNDGIERSVQLPLNTQDGDYWEGETVLLESRRNAIDSFAYYYIVADQEGNELRREWTRIGRKYTVDESKTFIFHDQWLDIPLNSHLYTSAYEVTTAYSNTEKKLPLSKLPLFRKTVLFHVISPLLKEGQKLAIVGSHPALGAWNTTRFLPMEQVGTNDWMLTLNVDWIGMPIEYKYVVTDEATHELVEWEEGDNRIVDGELAEGEVLVLCGEPLRLADKTWRAAGVCVPVFALRSEQSWGVGDFGDLKRFVDWASLVNMKVIQLLPVNDTRNSHRWGDSYPYNIMSAFALHPQYLDLNQLGKLKDKKLMTSFLRRRSELNALSYSDYEAVERVKTEYIHLIFLQEGEKTLTSEEFLAWRETNKIWLDDEPEEQFVQFHLHKQLKDASDYARQKGIFLKGDLPIGVSKDSREVKTYPAFFNRESQTGAPPDAFSMQGQNWGFPTYHWEHDGEKVGTMTIEDWFRSRL